MAIRVKQVQATPNPHARKFIVNQKICDEPLSFASAEAAREHPLAARLFAVHGVVRVLILDDFVTVNKSPETAWADITGTVRKILTGAEHARPAAGESGRKTGCNGENAE